MISTVLLAVTTRFYKLLQYFSKSKIRSEPDIAELMKIIFISSDFCGILFPAVNK